MWSAQIFDTQTGNPKVEVDLTASSRWGQGDLTERDAHIKLNRKYSRDQWHDFIARWYDRILVYMWDGVPVAESFITDAPSYNRRTNVVSIKHIGIEKILERRWMHGVGTSNGGGGYVPDGAFSVTGVSVAGAVTRVLQRAYRDPISAAWPIPVQLPAVESGSFSKSWPFYLFQNSAAIVRELTSREDGPKLDLRPILNQGKLDRIQRVGTLTGPRFDVYIDAEDSAAETAGFGLHGRDTATGMHLPGKGSEAKLRVGAAFQGVEAGLARDSIFWNKNEEDVDRLSEIARGRLAPLKRPTQRRQLTLKASKISPADMRIGATIGLHSDDGLWEPALTVATVVGFSGQIGEAYTVELQEA